MTASLRANSRKNKIIKTLSAGAYSKIVGVVVSFAIVPLAVGYLGADGYGLWVAVSSLVAMLSFVDGGAGNALVNMVSHATGKNSEQSIKNIVSSGFFVLLVIAGMGGSLFYGLSPYLPWEWIFGLEDNIEQADLQAVVLVVGLALFLGMPCAVVGNVEKGFQEGNIAAFWEAKGRLLTLVFVFTAIQMDLGLIGFAIAFVSGPIVAAIANSCYYFLIKRSAVAPSFLHVKADEVKGVMGVGGLFFVLQITSAIQSQGDNIIIANMLGPSAVSQYAICMQLFMAIPMFMALLWTPLWPAYREALASGDTAWVRRVLVKSLKLALLVGLPSAVILIAFAQQIIRFWVGEDLVPTVLLLFGCGIWMVFVLVGNVLAMFLNAIQWIRVQIAIAVCTGICNILITIFLIDKIGVEGAIYGTVLSFLICTLLPYSILIPKHIKEILNEKVATSN